MRFEDPSWAEIQRVREREAAYRDKALPVVSKLDTTLSNYRKGTLTFGELLLSVNNSLHQLDQI